MRRALEDLQNELGTEEGPEVEVGSAKMVPFAPPRSTLACRVGLRLAWLAPEALVGSEAGERLR
jgi:hypothetical protein